MVGRSPAWVEVRKVIEKAASSPFSVLITGETGTGKELVARAIHRISARRDGPFLKINGAAIPPTLWEAEMFGYEKGAFTGAVQSKPGRFELADGGTFFLDEVGEVPHDAQAKLLRVLEDREFERVGGVKTFSSDVRLICASNRDLKRDASQGKFREDLYYRINGIPIHLPPLRERREDLVPLSEFFLARTCRELGKGRKTIAARDPGGPRAVPVAREHPGAGERRRARRRACRRARRSRPPTCASGWRTRTGSSFPPRPKRSGSTIPCGSTSARSCGGRSRRPAGTRRGRRRSSGCPRPTCSG